MARKDKHKKIKNLTDNQQVSVKSWRVNSVLMTVVCSNFLLTFAIIVFMVTLFYPKFSIVQDEQRKDFVAQNNVYKTLLEDSYSIVSEIHSLEQNLSHAIAQGNKDSVLKNNLKLKYLRTEKLTEIFKSFHESWDSFYTSNRYINYMVVTDTNNNVLYSYYRPSKVLLENDAGAGDSNISRTSSPFEYTIYRQDNDTGNKKVPVFKLIKFGGYDVKKEFKTVSLKMIKDKDTFAYIHLGFTKLGFPSGLFSDVFIFVFLSIIVFIIISLDLSRKIVNPLHLMGDTMARMSEGDLSEKLEFTNLKEVNKLVQTYNDLTVTMQRLYSTLEAKVQDRTKELKSAYAELQNTQAIMVHSEKMKSLGELVAGIMHEINNPINFIYGNMTHLDNYSKDLIEIISLYEKYENEFKEDVKKELLDLKKQIDYDFLKSDMPDLIKSCKEGAERAKNIIQDLKSFSRMEEAAISDVDLPHEIDMTLNILHNKIKHKAQVHKEYIEYVPKIEAFGGQLNQVFMNIIDNAVGAIKEKGDIWIRIKLNEIQTHLFIEIEDNGVGMDEETCHKTFDPFFTTKPVGQGTGLGMSIAHKIIKSHQGEISVTSKEGEGTKFLIKLPLKLDRDVLNSNLKNEGEIVNG